MHLLVTRLVVVVFTQQVHQSMHGIKQQLKAYVMPTLLGLPTGVIHTDDQIALHGFIRMFAQIECQHIGRARLVAVLLMHLGHPLVIHDHDREPTVYHTREPRDTGQLVY